MTETVPHPETGPSQPGVACGAAFQKPIPGAANPPATDTDLLVRSSVGRGITPASTEAKGLTITSTPRPSAALTWRQADDTVWVATADSEYAGIAALDDGRFHVLDERSRTVGTAATIAEAEALLRRTPPHRVPRGAHHRPRRFGRGDRSRPHGSRRIMKEEKMPTGTVKWFNSEKGYGFIAPDDGSADVFAHYSEIASTGGYRNLDENQKVEYDLAQGPKGPQAANIRQA
ncbi:hypothetical protein GCM10023068_06850 [Leifsonia shinshuensis]|uniref:Cold shock CspA family protein n=2 Tax=Micrococcales TaxID=85006 RepID=A0A853CQX9_9MICO|nr:cold shock CspA family protein [Leifsonia shinshuensis]